MKKAFTTLDLILSFTLLSFIGLMVMSTMNTMIIEETLEKETLLRTYAINSHIEGTDGCSDLPWSETSSENPNNIILEKDYVISSVLYGVSSTVCNSVGLKILEVKTNFCLVSNGECYEIKGYIHHESN